MRFIDLFRRGLSSTEASEETDSELVTVETRLGEVVAPRADVHESVVPHEFETHFKRDCTANVTHIRLSWRQSTPRPSRVLCPFCGAVLMDEARDGEFETADAP